MVQDFLDWEVWCLSGVLEWVADHQVRWVGTGLSGCNGG